MADESPIMICRFSELAGRLGLVPEIDCIFFESSATKNFESDSDRSAFRERWLGRYLSNFPQWAYLALARDESIAGYLVGSLDDPAQTPLFEDIAYFKDWKALTQRFPAQLHINVASSRRGQGAGACLVAAFIEDARRAGAPGVHVVTGRGMRNVRFYDQNGFKEAGALHVNGRELVFLARTLLD